MSKVASALNSLDESFGLHSLTTMTSEASAMWALLPPVAIGALMGLMTGVWWLSYLIVAAAVAGFVGSTAWRSRGR
jgi:hypothetical protein